MKSFACRGFLSEDTIGFYGLTGNNGFYVSIVVWRQGESRG